jgi:uncharacterized protein involved in outer membrane biogenesis
MGKWRRVAAAIALVVAAAFVALALALHSLVDPQRVKALAHDKARAAWGRELTMGDVSVGLFPVPSVSAEDVVLSGRDGQGPLLRAHQVEARLALLELIMGRARLKRLDIDGATITLPPPGEAVPDVSPETTRRATATPQLLALTDLHLSDVTLVSGEAQARVTWHVEDASFSSSAGWRDADIDAQVSRNGQPVRIKATFADLSRVGSPAAASDGEVDLQWAQTHVALKGRIPLDHGAAQAHMHVDVKSGSLGDVFIFYALQRRPSAAFEAHFDLAGAGDRLEASNLQVALGAARGHGGFTLQLAAQPRRFDGNLSIDKLDWAQAMLDAGYPPKPKHNTGLAFNPDALAWPVVENLSSWQGTLDTDFGSLKLRNGVEMRGARLRFAFGGNRLDIDPLQADMLGGHGNAQLRFDGAKKTVKVLFDGKGVLLERWFHERGRPVPFTGGPMNVHADFTSQGDTMRDLAASATGDMTVRMGPGDWNSKHAGDREALMTNAFASEGAERVQFECVTANLPFRAGVARGRSMVGFKTAASELITSGSVDLRDESLDLHGHVRANHGVTIGLASIAGDVKIGGHLTKPEMSLDPDATPGVVARAGVAIATLGASVIGGALIEKLAPDHDDPCEKPVTKKDDGSAGR